MLPRNNSSVCCYYSIFVFLLFSSWCLFLFFSTQINKTLLVVFGCWNDAQVFKFNLFKLKCFSWCWDNATSLSHDISSTTRWNLNDFLLSNTKWYTSSIFIEDLSIKHVLKWFLSLLKCLICLYSWKFWKKCIFRLVLTYLKILQRKLRYILLSHPLLCEIVGLLLFVWTHVFGLTNFIVFLIMFVILFQLYLYILFFMSWCI